MGAQIILLREFMLVFMGNELVIGLLLALWMIINGAGAWSGKFISKKVPSKHLISLLFLLLIILPILTSFSIPWFRNVFFETGRMISLYELLAYASLIFFPVCFIGGLLFVLINFSAGSGKTVLQKIYAFESLGSMAGGGLVSVVFIYYQGADNFQSLEYLALFAFLFLGILHFRKRELLKSTIFLFFTVAMLLFAQFFDLGYIARQSLYPNQLLISTIDTPYGSLDITQTQNQQNIYETGSLIFESDNVISREEDVHYAVLQRQNASSVLCLGGGVSGTLPEIMKYASVEQVDYLEVNPVLFEIAQLSIDTLDSSMQQRIHQINEDPIHFIKKTWHKYDMVLVNEQPPVNVQTNRFYTCEFYRSVKEKINTDGVLSTRLPASENYLSDEELEIESVIYKTLQAVFDNVLVVPGKQHYFLASDGDLSLQYSSLLTSAKLNNKFVNRNYLDDHLLRMRSDALQSSYLNNVSLNHDFKPSIFMGFIRQWLQYFGDRFTPVLIAVFALLLVVLIFAGPKSLAVFASGFSGASAEIILLIAFQSLLGYLYLSLGLMITVFMGGLASGAFLSRYFGSKRYKVLISIQLTTAFFLMLLIAILYLITTFTAEVLIQFVFAVSIFIIALLVGLQYGSVFNSEAVNARRLTSLIYPADLLGAGLGSFITVLFLLPAFGVYFSLLILSALHFVVIGIVFLKRKRINFKG